MKRLAHTATCVLVIALASLPSHAQEGAAPSTQPERVVGLSLGGRVTFADGSPSAAATIFLRAAGETAFTQRSVAPDDEGRFTFENLAPGPYRVTPSAPGYVSADADTEKFVRPGDSVALTLTRGSVITGVVTATDGTPIVGIPVEASATRGSNSAQLVSPRSEHADRTDDRGVYRIFGLPSGEYVVGAGGGGTGVRSFGSGYDDELRTYYPSSDRAGATRVSVGVGQEVTSINIRYRGDIGHRVSGTVGGVFASQGGMNGAVVTIERADGSGVEKVDFVQMSKVARFSIAGIADGEYFVGAMSGVGTVDSTWADKKRIVVRGADVGGIVLALQPTGSVGGQVIVDAGATEVFPETCRRSKDAAATDFVVSTVRLDAEQGDVTLLGGSPYEDVPSRRGAYALRNVRSGEYVLRLALTEADLYVAAVELQKPSPPNGPPPPPIDVASGAKLAPGEKLASVRIRVARGAGSISGKLAAQTPRNPHMLPRVVLVPLEPERANEALRYRHTTVESGAFAFDRVAPGKYAIVVWNADASAVRRSARVSWIVDRAERDALRAGAKSPRTQVVEVATCQRLADVVLQVAATGPGPSR